LLIFNINTVLGQFDIFNFKPILRPLSDYKEKIKTVDGCDISIVDYCIDFAAHHIL